MLPANVDLPSTLGQACRISAAVGGVLTLLLLLKSVKDFTHSGPQLREEIRRHYWAYTLWAVSRLAGWAFLILVLMGLGGNLVYLGILVLANQPFSWPISAAAAVGGITVASGLQFLRHLILLPASLMASYHYSIKRLYPLWHALTPARVRRLMGLAAGAAGTVIFAATVELLGRGRGGDALVLLGPSIMLGLVVIAANWRSKARPVRARRAQEDRPNILMIGADTLRSDRLGGNGYPRSLTPFIDEFAATGVRFKNCFVPCARTAPSLLSLFTGAWPHRHGVRDNFVLPEDFDASLPRLPHILATHGYRTCAIGDWCAADLGKFDLGFDELDLPDDQWNVKYLVRQGPKDLRLFLSLFTHGWLGKRLLPELYYLAGVPLSEEMTQAAKKKLSKFAASGQPFLLNLFMATTHPPFGSEYPYYTMYSERDYKGGSKFVMEKLNDPFEIIRRQGDTRTEFDLDQIINLYDGCVRSFDDKVRDIVGHLERCGLRDNTIVVIYSDHGMEFFEHDTWGQGNSVVGDYSSRIPLIVVDPRTRQTSVVEEVVRSIDVAPTLLDLAGIPSAHAMQGRSRAAAVRGQPQEEADDHAFVETGIWLTRIPGLHPDHRHYPSIIELLEVPDKLRGTLAVQPGYQLEVVRAKDLAVRTRNWKLVYQPLNNGCHVALFNMDKDPGCTRNVSREHPEILQQLWAALSNWVRDTEISLDRTCNRGS